MTGASAPVTQFDAATLESSAYLHGLRSFRQMDAQGCAWMEPFNFLDWRLRRQQRLVVEHTMEQSARQVRASYYRERAASIRARAAASECAAVRADLLLLATDYELLANLVQSFPDTTEALDDLWSSLKCAHRAHRDVASR
jgi:hypothetical protein